MKNKNNIVNDMIVQFVDSDDYIELNDLFKNLIKCDVNKINKYIEEIERMIIRLNGFTKCVLK
jgi:hypothetical protein